MGVHVLEAVGADEGGGHDRVFGPLGLIDYECFWALNGFCHAARPAFCKMLLVDYKRS